MSEFNVSETIVKIKVVGVGGAGGNAINDMVESGISGVEFIAANTDAQDLTKSKASIKVQLGDRLTKGLGAGANPDVGKQAAEEDKEKIKELLEETDMLFITAGMGGGTGTGAAPVIAKIAKDMGILTIAVVTKPFSFEGEKRKVNAKSGTDYLRENVDTLVVIPNDKLFELPDKKITLKNAFEEANNILKTGIKGIAELVTMQGFINLDFADVRTIMSGSGIAMLGFGYAEGEERAKIATEQALSSPLLERSIEGAKRILLNVTGGPDLGLNEANEVATIINQRAGDGNTEVIFGTVLDENLENIVKITIIATDFDEVDEPILPSGGARLTRQKTNTEKAPASKRFVDYEEELDLPPFIRRGKVK
jgi:cell division protein FtsZ